MADTLGSVGLNTILAVATDTSPSNYVTIGEPQDITLNGETVEFAEFTHMQSTSGYREYKPTFKNGGEVTFTFNWTSDAAQATLKTLYNGSDIGYFRITYPNSKTHTFTAYVASLGTTAPMNGPLRKNCTLRITGAITEA